MSNHDARARYCIQAGIPREFLRDDLRCPACDEMHTAMHLDPDVTEILTREPWCESCLAGHKATPSSIWAKRPSSPYRADQIGEQP